MKAIYLGKYDAGIRIVEVYLEPDNWDARFYLTGKDNSGTKIFLGMKQNDWSELLSNTIHEITELIMTEMGLRFAPSPDISRENGNFIFHMDHTKFSEVAARVAVFLSEILPDLKKAFDKNKARLDKKKRK